MLFTYRYVFHTIETLQTWLDHLVKEVWCKASGDYSLGLLHPDLWAVVEEIFYDDRIHKIDLHRDIGEIHALFRDGLTAAQRTQVSAWYDANNDIEALCSNDPARIPATYAEIADLNADLAKKLKAFCGGLWSDVMHLKAVQDQIGTISDHYREFVKENDEGKCPYCGLSDIKGQHHSKREAYDHFLPKGTYPFVSVNFRNLAPMCHECNSSYKLAKDPTRHLDPIKRKGTGQRRKAFFSFAAAGPEIAVAMTLRNTDINALQPGDIDLQVTTPGHDEEAEAWLDVFGIDERYKAKCCAKNDGKVWYQRVVEQCENYDLSPAEMMAAEIASAEESPWSDANFLKKPFLQACEAIGLIK